MSPKPKRHGNVRQHRAGTQTSPVSADRGLAKVTRYDISLAVGLVIAVLLAYLPAIKGGYIWDDDHYVTENLTLLSLRGLSQIWTQLGATPQYYPLVHTTFWIEY